MGNSFRPFTRVDVLVLLGIIALVSGFVAVAIRKEREAANRFTCANNLKQIGLACHNYHDTYKSLPPGWWGAIPETGGLTATTLTPRGAMTQVGPANGPLMHVLAFWESSMSMQSFFAGMRSTVWDLHKATADFWNTEGFQKDYNLRAFENAAARFPFLQCPSDVDSNMEKRDGPFHSHAYYVIGTATFSFGNGGVAGDPKTATDPAHAKWGTSGSGEWSSYFLYDSFNPVTDRYYRLARVNYQPVAGLGHGKSPFYEQFEGVFTDRSAVSLGEIQKADGTSSTLMFGETCGQFHPDFGDAAFQHNLFSACGAPTHRGLQQRCSPRSSFSSSAMSDCDGHTFTTGFGQRARFGTFSSTHPGGVQFVFCDGSVRMISRGQTWVKGSADWYLVQQLAGYHDGFWRDCSALFPD